MLAFNLYSAVSGPNLSVHANVPFKCNGEWSGTAGKDGEVSWWRARWEGIVFPTDGGSWSELER